MQRCLDGSPMDGEVLTVEDAARQLVAGVQEMQTHAYIDEYYGGDQPPPNELSPFWGDLSVPMNRWHTIDPQEDHIPEIGDGVYEVDRSGLPTRLMLSIMYLGGPLSLHICQLTSLVSLGMSHNLITELPEEIGQLVNLEELWLRYNQLTRLPDSILTLTRLRLLNVANNRLTRLPDLSHITELDVSNQGEQGPEITRL